MVLTKTNKPDAAVKPKETKLLVPDIKKPVLDPLSKTLLEPGSLVDRPQLDDTWLLQKHRDIIRDYSDVHADEKEYISEWDAFISGDHITSEAHLQQVYVRFVEAKASWITAAPCRTTEFTKHLGYLKARGALKEAAIVRAFEIIRQARSLPRSAEAQPAKTTSPRAEYRPSSGGCAVCRQPVLGPDALICANLVSIWH